MSACGEVHGLCFRCCAFAAFRCVASAKHAVDYTVKYAVDRMD